MRPWFLSEAHIRLGMEVDAHSLNAGEVEAERSGVYAIFHHAFWESGATVLFMVLSSFCLCGNQPAQGCFPVPHGF